MSMGKNKKISVCMIVRNEEPSLAAAIESTLHLACELVVVDTGSTDRTVEIARRYQAKIIEGVDRMHKAKARNIAQEAATGDWIVFLDGDETFEDPQAIFDLLQSTDADAVYLRAVRCNTNGKQVLSQRQLRCWKRGLYEYKYRAHEVPLAVNGATPKILRTDLRFFNRPRPDPAKPEYTLMRLRMDVDENPDAARPLYYLARQLVYAQRYQEAEPLIARYLNNHPDAWDTPDAWYLFSQIHLHYGRVNDQLQALYMAVARAPRRRDFWGALAQTYYDRSQYDLAAAMLCSALEMMPPSNTYRDSRWYGAHIYDLLARCYWSAGKYEQGRAAIERATKIEPENARLQKNLEFFVRKLDDVAISSAE